MNIISGNIFVRTNISLLDPDFSKIDIMYQTCYSNQTAFKYSNYSKIDIFELFYHSNFIAVIIAVAFKTILNSIL